MPLFCVCKVSFGYGFYNSTNTQNKRVCREYLTHINNVSFKYRCQMKQYNVIMNGKSYSFRTNANMSELNVINNNTVRRITSAATIAKLLALFPESEQYRADHAEALKMNESLDAEFDRIDELAPDDDAKVVFKAIASKYEVGCVMGRSAAHAEALEINAQVNEELCNLARVIAGVNRSTYKHETKSQLIGAACAGVVDGLRERVGVVLSRDRLAETVTRAVVARNE